jgi:hypothetical protein
MFDKGKPVERRGRKAMDLQSRVSGTMTARPPKTNRSVLCLQSAFISEEPMTLKTQTTRTTRSASLLLAIFASLFYHPIYTRALGDVVSLPTLAEFSRTVEDGNAKVLRGVYVDGVLALPIVQQPSGSPAYVSTTDGEVTQFSMPARYGNIGLLAHNHLSGKFFANLAIGQKVSLVYGDGKIETFVISEVLRYQALQPTSPYSSFRDMDSADETLSADQMFRQVYLGDHHITFQTCIDAYGNSSWGRLFVIAVPQSDIISIALPQLNKMQ